MCSCLAADQHEVERTGALRILIVEDEQAHAELICDAFEAQVVHGREVEGRLSLAGRPASEAAPVRLWVVRHLNEASRVIETFRPDLVVTDLLLPDGKGTELLPEDKESVAFPVVVMTSHGDEQAAVDAMKAGALDYVVKTGTTLADMPHICARALREWEHLAERRRVEEALRQSEERFRELYDEAPVGYHELDDTGRIVGVNGTELEMLGYTAEEMLGRYMWEFTEQPELVRDSVLRKLAGRIPAAESFERVYCRKDGTTIPLLIVDRYLYDDHGQVIGIRSTVEDITERKRAERALRFTQFSVDRATDAIFWIAPDARIIDANQQACERLGYSRAELLGMTIQDIDLAFSPQAWARHWKDLTSKGSLVVESQYRTREGQVFPVELSVNYLEFEGESFNCTFARDVTERKRLEDQLRHSQKMEAIGQLAGGVAHDFNNLLTVILCNNELLLSETAEGVEPLDAASRHSALEQIRQAGERGASLTQQLLAFSRKQMRKLQVLDLNRIVADMEDMLRRLIGEHIEVVTRLGPKIGRIHADLGQIQQVIMNLAVNARDAMPRGGRLTIETANARLEPTAGEGGEPIPGGEFVMLAVTDTGAGMDAETRKHVFEPFFTTKSIGQGTGLGLATVYGIVRQAEGRITVDSEPGQGAAFRVYLPLSAEQPAQPPRRTRPPAQQGQETVLLCEDEELVRQLARTCLTSKGYVVLEAENGEQALQVASDYAGTIDLLVTDIVMPGMNGQELAERLRAQRGALPVLMMSGYTADIVGGQAKSDENSAFLQKPFKPAELVQQVRTILDRRADASSS